MPRVHCAFSSAALLMMIDRLGPWDRVPHKTETNPADTNVKGKLSQSPRVERIHAVPGNGGTAHVKKVFNVTDVEQDDFPGLVAFAVRNAVNLVVPGPEVPLVAGIEGHFRKAGIKCFGPSQEAARMEGSKTFSKDFMSRWKIPTAAYGNFTVYEEARDYLNRVSHNVVIKADGLAGGKGVGQYSRLFCHLFPKGHYSVPSLSRPQNQYSFL